MPLQYNSHSFGPSLTFAPVLIGGPASLLTLLHVHWRVQGARSWLGQVEADIRHVAMYVPAVATLSIKSAHRQVQLDLQHWDQNGETVAIAATPAGSGQPPAYACPWCHQASPLRKHVHMARTRGSCSREASRAWARVRLLFAHILYSYYAFKTE